MVTSYRRFGQTCSLHFEYWTNLKDAASIFHETPIINNRHDVAFQKTIIFVHNALKL
jgi:hypothetical protein